MEIVSASIAHAFVNAINHQSPEEIASLMTEDHVFIDSLGMRVTGREQMKQGWKGYFSMVPDYTITVDETFADGSVVVMLGAAQGTYSSGGPLKPENRWQRSEEHTSELQSPCNLVCRLLLERQK